MSNKKQLPSKKPRPTEKQRDEIASQIINLITDYSKSKDMHFVTLEHIFMAVNEHFHLSPPQPEDLPAFMEDRLRELFIRDLMSFGNIRCMAGDCAYRVGSGSFCGLRHVNLRKGCCIFYTAKAGRMTRTDLPKDIY
jgi:hypothetical protein